MGDTFGALSWGSKNQEGWVGTMWWARKSHLVPKDHWCSHEEVPSLGAIRSTGLVEVRSGDICGSFLNIGNKVLSCKQSEAREWKKRVSTESVFWVLRSELNFVWNQYFFLGSKGIISFPPVVLRMSKNEFQRYYCSNSAMAFTLSSSWVLKRPLLLLSNSLNGYGSVPTGLAA